MKRLLAVLLCVCLMMIFPASAEELPNTEGGYDAYLLEYDAGLLPGWSVSEYAEAAGLILYASCETADLTVSLEEKQNYDSAMAYLEGTYAEFSQYNQITAVTGPTDWTDPWNKGGGSSLSCQIASSLGEGQATASTRVEMYALPFNDAYYLVLAFNAWSDDSDARYQEFAGAFLTAALSIQTVFITDTRTAYLRGATEENGTLMLQLDFCDIAYDETVDDVSVVNDDMTAYPYALWANARVWLPDGNSGETRMYRGVDLATLTAFVENYRAATGEDCLMQILFSNSEAVWMGCYFQA